MNIIVGLGNPGTKYKNTRHNIGFMIVDRLVGQIQSLHTTPEVKSKKPRGFETRRKEIKWQEHKKFKGNYVRVASDLLIVKPQTYMNLSGQCVSLFVNFYKVDTANVWAVHDDIDLPFGKIRIRIGGGSGGHRGIESIVKEVGSNDFVRFRAGIGRDLSDPEKYVLLPFTKDQREKKDRLVEEVVSAICLSLTEGLETAMNEYN